MKKALIFLLAVMLLSFILPSVSAEDPILAFGEGEPDILGKPFPDFTLKDTRRNEFTLSEALKDHDAVLINFWEIYCDPCMREFPLLNEVYQQYKDRVAFIGLDFDPDDTLLDIANIRIEKKLGFPMGKTAGTGLNEYLGFLRLPSTLIIDRFGTLCFMQSNVFQDANEIARLLDTFLGDDYTESKVLSTVPMEKSTRAFPVSGAFTFHVDNENTRKIVIRYDNDDYIPEYAFIVPDDIAHLRFELTPDDPPGEMVYSVYTDTDRSWHALPSLLDPEKNAYVYDQPMNLLCDGHPVVQCLLQGRTLDNEKFISFFLFPSEESVDEYLDLYRKELPFSIYWEYVDDEEPAAPQPETYILHLIDQYGDPVPNVKVNFCTDAACTMLISDESGLIAFSSPVENYHIQLLKAPEGYSFDPDFELYTGSTFGEWDILVRKD